MTSFACPLPHRGVVRISGEDSGVFLQGLMSNDINRASERAWLYAALLTPQGKFLHDLFILKSGDAFLIDCEAARADALIQRLTAHRLRSKVAFENLSDRLAVWAFWGESGHFPDPRLPELGARAFVDKDTLPANVTPVDFSLYDIHRLSLGAADGSRDLIPEKSTLAEGNIDVLNGISWTKGCYMGQELTARMRYRGLAKKRLFPVRCENTPPPFGTPLFSGDAEIGDMRSSCGDRGLALLNFDAAQRLLASGEPLTYENGLLFPEKPAWLNGSGGGN